MTLLAVITKQDVILKILSHLNVPRYALVADEPSVAYYDMTATFEGGSEDADLLDRRQNAPSCRRACALGAS